MAAIQDKNYEMKFVAIKWKYSVIDDWIRELNKVYAVCDREETILAGFSFGAMAAFLAAADRSPSELWLFSLSPYFAEDLSELNSAWLKYIGKRRRKAFMQCSFNSNSKLIKSKTLIFVGDMETNK